MGKGKSMMSSASVEGYLYPKAMVDLGNEEDAGYAG